jgi:hypothetical protein
MSGPLKLRESSMHHTHGSSSFANGRSHALDASSADVAHSEYSWEAAFKHLRRTGKRPRRIAIWINSQWQITSGEDKALLIKSDTPSKPVGVGRGAGHNKEMMDRRRTHLPRLLDPIYFFEVVLALKTG